MISNQRTLFSIRCEWIALATLSLCLFCLPISVSCTSIIFLLAWVFILLSGNWRHRWQRIRSNPAAISFWVLLALFLIGLSYTASPAHDAWRDLQKRHWLLITPFLMMIIDDARWRARMINAFLAAMVLILFLSYAKWFGNDTQIFGIHDAHSGVNVFSEYTVQYFFMNIAAAIFAYRFFYHPRWRGVNLVILIFMIINIFFMARSRTGYITFLPLLCYVLWVRFGYKGLISTALALIILAPLCYMSSPIIRHRLQAIPSEYTRYYTGDTITDIGLRVGMWQDAEILIKQHPWFGYGTGGIRAPMKQALTQNQIQRTGPIDYVEFAYINFILEFGFIGFAIFISVLITQIILSFFLEREYRFIMHSFLIVFLVGALVNSYFVSFCQAHFYSLISAICFSAFTSRKSSQIENPHAKYTAFSY